MKRHASLRNVTLFVATLGVIIGVGVFQLQHAKGAAYTWDGGGTDGTCGGAAGDGNKWSCAANWSSDIVPGASDTVTFNSTSTKNVTISAAVTVTSITISSGYTGIITQSGSSTISTTSGYSQADGTFTGGSGTISVAGAAGFTLSGGTFTSTTNTLTVTTGGWTHTAGGTFNHNSGTVTMAGTSSTVDVATTESFSNLIIGKTNGNALTVASGDTVVVLGTFTYNDGLINTGTVEVRAGMTVASTADGGGGTISYLTTGDQVITTTTGATLPNLNIAKSSGTVSFASSQDLTVASFTLSSGTFTSTSGTIRTNGAWTHTAGTFNHNNGTVLFGNNTTALTIDVPTTANFYNFTIAMGATSTTRLINSGETVVVENDLTMTTGTLNGGTIEVRGNTTLSNPATSGIIGTTVLLYTGTGDKVLSIAAATNTIGSLNVNKSSGKLTWSGPGVTMANFTLQSGEFVAPSGTIIITTAWTHTGGTFTHNNGTIQIVSSSNLAMDLPTTATFYNFTLFFNNASFNLNLGTGDTLVVAGTYTQNRGQFATGTIEVQGNVVTAAATTAGGSGTLSFTTAGDQTITGVASTGGALPILSIAKPSGTVLVTDNIGPYGIVLSSGTFNGGTGTISVGTASIAANVSISGGTFISTSGNMSIASAFTQSGSGIFNHNNGTVTFGGGTGNSTWNLHPNTRFNNFAVSASNAARTLTIATGDTLVVEGNFTGTLGIITGGTLEVRGDYSQSTNFSGGTASLRFTGNGNQTYSDNGGTKTTGAVTIDKAPGAKLTLATNMTYTGGSNNVTVTSGTLDQGASYNLSTGALAIGSNGVLLNLGTGSLTVAGTVTNNGLIHLNSNGVTCGDTDSILVRSSVTSTQRSWAGTGKFVLVDVDVRDMAGSATVVAVNSTNTANNGVNWTFNSTCPPLVTAPNGAESWTARSTQNITFSSYSGADHYRLFYSLNDGASWTEIGTTASTNYSWTVPAATNAVARVLVAAEDSGNTMLAQDLSDAVFSIQGGGTTLNGGVIFKGGVSF